MCAQLATVGILIFSHGSIGQVSLSIQTNGWANLVESTLDTQHIMFIQSCTCSDVISIYDCDVILTYLSIRRKLVSIFHTHKYHAHTHTRRVPWLQWQPRKLAALLTALKVSQQNGSLKDRSNSTA